MCGGCAGRQVDVCGGCDRMPVVEKVCIEAS